MNTDERIFNWVGRLILFLIGAILGLLVLNIMVLLK